MHYSISACARPAYALLFGLLLLGGQACLLAPTAAPVEAVAKEITPPRLDLEYLPYTPREGDIILSRTDYAEGLYGFWLGQCIANWTGLITEMDKIGGAGKNGRAAGFYTRTDWGQPDQANLWGSDSLFPLAPTIDFYFVAEGDTWGADDDTDIEYMYQHLLYTHGTTVLSPAQIREGWLTHIYSDSTTPFTTRDGSQPENYLWVSNQRAFDLMQEGMLPPHTSLPANNPHYEMIDAQLTTEIFGLYAPLSPAIALQMAALPIRTTAYDNAQWIAEFYVIMHALALWPEAGHTVEERIFWMADQARQRLPETSYAADMYDYVQRLYRAGIPWEATRDSIYVRYQVQQAAGYSWGVREPACHGCFSAGINFAASLVSLFYGGGDIRETIKIGTLAGWDSDNPTATWGGLLGFMLGKEGIEAAFGRTFSDQFNIHRTRGCFPQGTDNFTDMAQKGLVIVDRVIQDRLGGGVDLEQNRWYIPPVALDIAPPLSN